MTEDRDEPLLKERLVPKGFLESLPPPDVAVDREQHPREHQKPDERRDIDLERAVEVAARSQRPSVEPTLLARAHLRDQFPNAVRETRGLVRANDLQGQGDLGVLVERIFRRRDFLVFVRAELRDEMRRRGVQPVRELDELLRQRLVRDVNDFHDAW